MKIEVYVKEAVYCISCGVGVQKIRWVAECAALKYDRNGMMRCGEPKAVRLADGTLLNFNDRISDRLMDNSRIWLIFDDLQQPDRKKDPKNKKTT